MSILAIKPAGDCRYDLVALGEVMLRFDPGDGRIATTRTFAISEGGGEYNVARGLRRCFGLRKLVEQVDVLLGNEEDFSAALRYTLEGVDESHRDLDVSAYERLHREVLDGYPNLSLVATSLREAHTATVNDWSGVCSTREAFFVGPEMRGLEIFDRVGGGDSFASGLVYGLLCDHDLATSLAYGIAHGALAMTTPGDTSMTTLEEVERVMRGGAARVIR